MSTLFIQQLCCWNAPFPLDFAYFASKAHTQKFQGILQRLPGEAGKMTGHSAILKVQHGETLWIDGEMKIHRILHRKTHGKTWKKHGKTHGKTCRFSLQPTHWDGWSTVISCLWAVNFRHGPEKINKLFDHGSFAEQLPAMTHRNFHLSDSDTRK